MKNKLTKLAMAGAISAVMACSTTPTGPEEPQYSSPSKPSSSSLYVAPSSSSTPTQQPSSSSKQSSKTIDDYIDEYCNIAGKCDIEYSGCKEQMEADMNLPQYKDNKEKQEESMKQHIRNVESFVNDNCR